MGFDTKEMGGGPTVGLAQNYVSVLQRLLNGGGLGAAGSPDAAGSTGDIMGVLSDILAGGQGKAGSAIAQLLSKQQERDVNALRARFGQFGGQAFGTPAAFAESLYRSEAAPQITQAITGLQLQAIMPLLQAITGLSGRGITQRQLVQEKSPIGQALDVIGQVGGAALPFLQPGFGAGGGNSPFLTGYAAALPAPTPTLIPGRLNPAPSFFPRP